MQIIRKANSNDIDKIEQVVGQAGLQTNGIEQNVDNFLVMETEEKEDAPFVAVVGFELQQQNGLLRSFVLNQKTDQFNIVEVMRAVINFSKKNNLRKLFLCTNHQSSVQLFQLLGFKVAEEIPVEIKDFNHFKNINSEQPVIMYYTF